MFPVKELLINLCTWFQL